MITGRQEEYGQTNRYEDRMTGIVKGRQAVTDKQTGLLAGRQTGCGDRKIDGQGKGRQASWQIGTKG